MLRNYHKHSADINSFSSKFDLFWDNTVADGKDHVQIMWSLGGMSDDIMNAVSPILKLIRIGQP